MNDRPAKTRRPSGSKNQPVTGTLLGALEGGTETVDSLREEIESWKDSLSDNNMEHLEKYSEVEECYEALQTAHDALEAVEVPEVLNDIEVKYTEDTRRKARARSYQLSNARNALDAAVSGAQEWLVDNETLSLNDPAEEGYDEEEPAVTEEEVNERESLIDDVQTFADELEAAIGELDNVSFPSMY